jgi:dienelactone hydrolase
VKLRLVPLALLLAVLPLSGQGFIPPAQKEKATPGDAALTEYFRNETAALSQRCLADFDSRADFDTKRGEYRRQLQEMLGLWPLPERTDLKAVVTGRGEADGFAMEKLHFQASPGLYVTANLFIPKHLTNPAPAILYECGHWRLLTNGVSYGNKAVYQFDGAWFARNGYVCLVMDSLRDGEIRGIHTGTRDNGMWWWNSRGYTPEGVEAWFGIRALDYLSTRPEVDTNRFGITGHSGGGAYSWMVTALDDRIKVAAPLSGMTDLQRHVCDNLMDSHCDCNFPINIYRWDFPQVAALAAPRPLLLGGTDNDPIFPPPGTLALHQKLADVYKILNVSSNLAFCLAPGVHDEVPELRLAVLRWFNRQLKGMTKETEQPIVVDAKKLLTPEQVRVFTNLPADAINTNIAETFVPKFEIRNSKYETVSEKLRAALREKVFAGWPADDLPLEPKQAFAVERYGVIFSAWDFTSLHDVELRLYFFEKTNSPADTVSLTVLDATGWTNWLQPACVFFGETLTNELKQSPIPLVWSGAMPFIPKPDNVLAFIAPRGVGLTAWSGDEKRFTKIRRRFMAVGQTLDGMRVWDIRRAIQMIHFVREGDLANVELKADGAMAVNALYAGLFESSVRKLELTNLPKSHTEGPDYLGVLKLTDIPQVKEAVAAQAELKPAAQ